MKGPLLSEGVWLVNGWAKTAHRLSGERKNMEKVPCGLSIWSSSYDKRVGEFIRWGHLDHQAVNLCKVCWKGYEPVYSRTYNELCWWGARHKRIESIFAEAWVVISTPTHLDQFKVDGPGGNVVFQGTMLNYETLKSMLKIMVEEEVHRKRSRHRMGELMRALGVWEFNHPYGEPLIEDIPLEERVSEPPPLTGRGSIVHAVQPPALPRSGE